MKNKDTVLFLGVWEQLNNSGFNSLEFAGIENEAVQIRNHQQRQEQRGYSPLHRHCNNALQAQAINQASWV